MLSLQLEVDAARIGATFPPLLLLGSLFDHVHQTPEATLTRGGSEELRRILLGCCCFFSSAERREGIGV